MSHIPTHQNRRAFLGRLTAATVACVSTGVHAGQSTRDSVRRFDAKQFGATGDGVTVDTASIQLAIDAASKSGGGIVTLTKGSYVTGTLLLKSRVSLEIQRDAILLGSVNPADYKLVEPFTDGTGQTRGYAMLGCIDCQDLSVFGPGTIDGRGAVLHAAAPGSPAAKPFLVLCARSAGIQFRGLTILNSAAWTMHIFQSSRVTISSTTIRSVGLANNDGIDIDSSQQVDVSDCNITSGDDAICLKTTSPVPCRDIRIANCTMTTRCAAFKIGTETAGDFSRISLRHCHVVRADLGAIKLLSVDGARISDVTVEDMRVDDCDTPIFLRLGSRGRNFRPGDVARPAGSLSAVRLRRISVSTARRVGVLISGIPGHPVEDVTLDDVAITMAGDPAASIPPNPPENPAAYPEVRMFGAALPASGLYARHVVGLLLNNVKIVPAAGDVRPERLIQDE